MIVLDPLILTNFEAASSREWLETNGLGSFSSGTISGANTRRYHGIFTSATEPPLGRITMLAKLEDVIEIDGTRHELSTNQYPDKVHPQGLRYLESFRLDPFPTWVFQVDDLAIEKKIFMTYGKNAVVCRWNMRRKRRSDTRKVALELHPLLSFVDYHHLRREGTDFVADYREEPGVVFMQPVAGMPPIAFRHDGAEIEKTGHWYRDFEYAVERERGFDHHEDLFQPFALRFQGGSASMIISSPSEVDEDAAKLEKAEIKRRNTLVKQAGTRNEFESQLVLAADQFIVSRGAGHTIIAGYPWFSDWGRDTMIALPGLTLATGRPTIAREILLEFSKHISQGMLPNRFPDAGGEAEYNTVDATLWYFEAIRAYAAYTGDHDFVRDELYEKLADIIVWHVRGTRYNIHVDTDGLLYAGEPGLQLTWMDAKIGDLVVTPRTGKAVEIQALWHNALRVMAEFADHFGDHEDRTRYTAMADLAKLSFNALFWNEEEECLFDVVENGNREGSVRPNQILAVSLPFPILDEERWPKVVNKVGGELVTRVGLRSLTPKDPKYVPVYTGSPFERDSAYHQGTVWTWLIGPFTDAYRKVYPRSEARVEEMVSGLRSHMSEAGIGQISEIFDAEPPHRPRGCPAQAWSVAEVLRVLVISAASGTKTPLE
ncbi:MAG TPA: amylo-alpha-1,6-glucosidase [Pyrinomonadaceae bacterium]|nr:amylo-alpha-1,6-glucosidase [Pyrinomonadaceae bacterium]